MMTAAIVLSARVSEASPPSGRPPEGPLRRLEPRIYDFGMSVVMSTEARNTPMRDPRDEPPFDIKDSPIVMPMIFNSTFSAVDQNSMAARLWLVNEEDTGFNQRSRVDGGMPFNTHLAVMPIVRFQGKTLRWEIRFQTKTWSSAIDDQAAAQIAWPAEWPAEALDGLKPQKYIESDDPIFKQAVETVTKGKLRMVAPYLAAKELVRYCCSEIQVSGDATYRGQFGEIRGLIIDGALAAAKNGRGTSHDLVCICVATLRAAGIPARPVVGVWKDDNDRSEFISWGEIFLPDCGWIPFDPDAMRGKGIRNKDPRTPWGEFGTMDDLNRRIPLAFYYIPPASVQTPGWPAVWAWDPRPEGNRIAEQSITLSIVSRGRAPDDGEDGRER
jgi:hypothetical protein